MQNSPFLKYWLFFLCWIPLTACSHSPAMGTKPKPAHHTETGFKNLYLEKQEKSFFDFLQMRLFDDITFPDQDAIVGITPSAPIDVELMKQPGSVPQVTWIGHSTFLIQYQGLTILTDPMFSERASPFSFIGPKRYMPPAMAMEALPKIDYVIISHDHYDHLDVKSTERLDPRATWLVPLGLKAWVQDRGVAAERIQEMDWWDTQRFEGLSIKATPSQHFSGRSLWDRFETLWASWVLEFDDYKIWFGGDTGYNEYQFKEIGQKEGPFDLALIPIGAYEPRWFMKAMHVNPEEAVLIHQDVRARHSIGMHWGTFVLTAEPPLDPPLKLKEALQKYELPPNSFQALKIGETYIHSSE